MPPLSLSPQTGSSSVLYTRSIEVAVFLVTALVGQNFGPYGYLDRPLRIEAHRIEVAMLLPTPLKLRKSWRGKKGCS